MSLRTVGVAVIAVILLVATTANRASAEESPGAWYTGPSPGAKLLEGSTKTLTTALVSKSLTLESDIFGAPVHIAATGLNCNSCVIKNVGTSAIEEGSLEFAGVTMTEPAGCEIVGGAIKLKPFKAAVGMQGLVTAVIPFAPIEGVTLATVEVSGEKCSPAFAGLYKINGSITATMANQTGVFGKSQGITLTGSGLKFGLSSATLTGSAKESISPEKEFAVGPPRASGSPYEESPSAWYTGVSPGTRLPAGTTQAITTETTSGLQLETTVAGKNLILAATGLSCVSCVLENVGTKATMAGALKFTGISVSEPTGCGVASTIETKKVTGTVGMEQGSGTVALVKLAPKEGATFATIELTGASCPLGGLYKVTGTIFAKANSATGVFGKSQAISLSQEIQQTAGSETSLKFGEHPAFLTGTVNANAAIEYAAKEK